MKRPDFLTSAAFLVVAFVLIAYGLIVSIFIGLTHFVK